MINRLDFHKPRLKEGVDIVKKQEALEIHYLGEEFSIAVDNNDQSSFLQFLNNLDGSLTLNQLVDNTSDWDSDDIHEFLLLLDQMWLLTDAGQIKPEIYSGLDLILECEDLQRYLVRNRGENRLTRTITSGQATEKLLHGFTFEYYHVTSRVYDCLAPALSMINNSLCKNTMRRFFSEEYQHDLLVLKALENAGYTKDEVTNSVPLPYTAAVSNMLGSLAAQDPLSFMAVLFMFEGKPWEDDYYVEALGLYKLPEGFVKYQKIHSEINQNGEHGLVSREMIATYPVISSIDRKRVLKNICLMFDTLSSMYNQIYDYYTEEMDLPRKLEVI